VAHIHFRIQNVFPRGYN